MVTYKGNVGHLMQHWTLCEVLTAAQKHTTGLNFIDAHAMTPWATEPTDLDNRFTGVRNDLPGQNSVYERAWQCLAAPKKVCGYPSSAAFVREVWAGNYSLLLCEIDSETADKIQQWLRAVGQETNCKKPELFRGDWRSRFELGLPRPADPGDSLTLVTFDPHLCSWHRGGYPNGIRNGEYWDALRPQDLERALLPALGAMEGGIVIQMSTYTAQNNAQDDVIEIFDATLVPGELHRQAKVRVDGHMMSLVYAKNVACTLSNELAELPGRFDDWLPA